MTTTTKEAAKGIRKELKSLGFDKSMVRVTGSTPKLSIVRVRAIADSVRLADLESVAARYSNDLTVYVWAPNRGTIRFERGTRTVEQPVR